MARLNLIKTVSEYVYVYVNGRRRFYVLKYVWLILIACLENPLQFHSLNQTLVV